MHDDGHMVDQVQADFIIRCLERAEEEGFDEIADWFETLAKAEKSHAGRFEDMLKSIE